jgi:hypothetical protein
MFTRLEVDAEIILRDRPSLEGDASLVRLTLEGLHHAYTFSLTE